MPPIIRSDSQAPSPPETQDNRRALGLAVMVHILLLIMLIFGVNWRSENPGPVQVELWADGVTPNVTPPEPEPEPEPEPPKPAPIPAPAPAEPTPPPPQPEATPQPDPEIALEAARKKREQEEQARQAVEAAKEKARQDEIRRQAELKEKQRLDQERRAAEQKAAQAAAEQKAKEEAAKRAAAEKAVAEKAAAEKAAAEQKAKEEAAKKAAADKKAKEAAAKKAAADKALREAMRADVLGAAGIPGGTADRNQAGGGRDDGYGAKVRACIQPGVAYPPPARTGSTNPTAQYRVQLGKDGSVTNVTLKSSSGNAGFDRAVETGIRRCNPFPKPSTGRYEPIIDVVYRMYD